MPQPLISCKDFLGLQHGIVCKSDNQQELGHVDRQRARDYYNEEKGSGTRSGLLWEVERLLNEVEELPQVLLMENVPQVIGKKNIEHFNEWREFLESKGYKFCRYSKR